MAGMTDPDELEQMRKQFKTWSYDDLPARWRDQYICERTGEYGIHSGRDRFKVTCKKCGKVVHGNTTWPNSWIGRHEWKCHC